jgi:predicted flap endonuclease-1-like 5' DNA nuclease
MSNEKRSIDNQGGGDKPAMPANPLEGFAAASALGVAMTTQALEMWFGMLSGVARASQDILAGHVERKPREPAAYAPEPKSAVVNAKAAARTVAADVERMTADVAAVATDLLGGKQAAAGESDAKSNVIPLKPKHSATAAAGAEIEPVAAKPKADKVAKKPTVRRARPPKAVQTIVAAKSEPVAGVAASIEAYERVEAVATAEPIALSAAVETPKASAGDSPLMPEDFRRPKAMDKPDAPDDLKSISGVGPKLEKVLNGLGIWTYDQISDLEKDEIAWLDDYLGLNGRFQRDGWAGQAAKLGKVG